MILLPSLVNTLTGLFRILSSPLSGLSVSVSSSLLDPLRYLLRTPTALVSCRSWVLLVFLLRLEELLLCYCLEPSQSISSSTASNYASELFIYMIGSALSTPLVYSFFILWYSNSSSDWIPQSLDRASLVRCAYFSKNFYFFASSIEMYTS